MYNHDDFKKDMKGTWSKTGKVVKAALESAVIKRPHNAFGPLVHMAFRLWVSTMLSIILGLRLWIKKY